MSRASHLMPLNPHVQIVRVVSTRRLSPSFQRITLASGNAADEYAYSGFDHWFRLFIPREAGAPFELPGVAGRSWWKAYLALDESERPHCSNYTVAAFRTTDDGFELDIDVVLHWDPAGELTAPVARWSTTAEPGSPAGILDQGLLFDPVLAGGPVVIVCDETGLPGVRGILRGLDAAAEGVAIIEVPTTDDIVQLDAPAGVVVHWVARGDQHAVSGVAALKSVRALDGLSAEHHAYVVGESALATEGRRWLHRAGIPKSHIMFSGYWKHSTEPALVAQS